MTPEQKAAYHHGNLKRVLMDEALRTVRDQGVDALSLRSLSREAGVSHAAPYAHFADRTALLHALAHEGHALMDARMAEGEETAEGDPARRLKAIGMAYVTFAVEHPDYYAVMRLGESPDPSCDTEPEPEQANTWNRLMDAVVDCQAAGVLPEGDSMVLGLYLWSLVHGLAGLWAEGTLSYLPQARAGLEPMADAVLGVCIGSLKTFAEEEER